jgi:hypothetical protein
MARDTKKIQVVIPDNFYLCIDAMCKASGESVTEYCARAILTKAEHDLMVKLPEKWRSFTDSIEPKA